MAYGDEISFGTIKRSEIKYEKPSKNSFSTEWVTTYIINSNNWYYTLEFKNRKEWFKFVRHINKLNKEFKKMKNIELLGSDIDV